MLADRRLALPAWTGIALALATTTVACAVTVASIATAAAGAATATSLVALAPISAIVTMVVAISRGGAPDKPKLEPAMLGAVPTLLAATLLAVFGPARLGYSFWFVRVDLVVLLLFAIGTLMLAVGVRSVLGRFGVPWVVVLCAAPVAAPLVRLAESALGAATRTVSEAIARAVPLGARALGDGLFAVPGGGRVSVASACTGLEAVAALALLAGPLVVGTEGPRRRKALVLAALATAAWIANVGRVVALLALAGHDRTREFGLAHRYGGVVLIALLAIVLLAVAHRAGLRWRMGSLATRVSYSANHVLWGVPLVAVAALVIASSQLVLARPGLAGAAVSRVERIALERDADGHPHMFLSVPGHATRHDREYRWFSQFFGGASRSSAYTITRRGRQPVWAQVIVATSRRRLDQYGPVACFVAHGAVVYRVRRVPLPGGAGMLVEQRLRSARFSALSWVQPVVLEDGRPGFRRVVLFALAEPGIDSSLPTPPSRLERVAFSVMNALSPMPTRSARGYAFGPANERLDDVARRMLGTG